MTQLILLIAYTLGWTLLHSVWQGAIIGLLFVLSRSVLRSASPAIRHINALAWLVLFAAFPVFTFISLLLAAPAAGVLSGAPSLLSVMQITLWPAESESLLPGVLSVAGSLWMGGVMVLSTRLLGEWRRLERFTCFGRRPLPQLDLVFDALRTAMNVRIKVGLVEAANATVPMVIGFFRPVIVLPGSALLGLTPRELELIIAHELAHLRRKDHLINYLLIAAETLLFFHPVVYMLTRTIRHERELCCDDLVINTFNERVCYAHALSKLEAMRAMDMVPSTLRLAAADGPLVTRIARLVRSRTHKRWGVLPAAMLPLVAATFAIAVFHQTHVVSGPDDSQKSSRVAVSNDKGRSLVGPSPQKGAAVETELHRVRLPDYPRRSVAATTVSRITRALTQSDTPQSLQAIEGGAKIKVSDSGLADAPALTAGQELRERPDRVFTASTGMADRRLNDTKFAGTLKGPAAVARLPMDLDVAVDKGRAESGDDAAGGSTMHKLDSTNTSDTGGSKVVDMADEASALIAPVARQAGLSALPAYRPELPTASAATLPKDNVAIESNGVGGLIETGGALIHRVTPRYPTRARSRGFVDKVVVSIDVDESGRVNGVSVINRDSRPMFRRAVVRAVTQWEFEPLLRNGKAVERTVEQSFNFRLEPLAVKRRSQNCRDTRGDHCELST